MIVSCSLIAYTTKQIKTMFDTSISELSSTGIYDYNPNPEFSFIYPTGSEKIISDVNNPGLPIQWTSELPQLVPAVTLSYATSTTPYTIITIINNTGSYNWMLNNSVMKEDTTYQLKISADYLGNTIQSITDTFSIAFSYIKILPSLTRSTVFTRTSVFDVPFVVNNISNFVKIDVYRWNPDTKKEEFVITLEDAYSVEGNGTKSYTVNASKIPFTGITIMYPEIRISDANNLDIFADTETFNIER